MRSLLAGLAAIIVVAACQPKVEVKIESDMPDNMENSIQVVLEDSLGDEYGMNQYVMAFLYAGPNRDRSPEEAASLQRAHLDNIGRMAKEGKLVLAGPFLDDGELRGIYIFNVGTVEEARQLTETDPAIQAGSLVMELRPWYGSAALLKLGEIHDRIKKKDI